MNKKSPGEAEGMQISFKEILKGQIFNSQGKELRTMTISRKAWLI